MSHPMVRSSSQGIAGEDGSETTEPAMSMWRAGSHECEPVSFHAIPLRYSIGQGHPVVDTCPVHEGRFCHQSGVSGFPHAGQFHWTLITSVFVLALVTPGAGLAQEQTSADAPTSPAPTQPAPIGPPAPEGQKQFLNWETGAGRSYIIPAVELYRIPLPVESVRPALHRTGGHIPYRHQVVLEELDRFQVGGRHRPLRHKPVPPSVWGINLLWIATIDRSQLLAIARVC